MVSEELIDDLRDKEFIDLGYCSFKSGGNVRKFVKHTFGTVKKQLVFLGCIFENSKHYICDYDFKKHLNKHDIEQLNEIENEFAEIVGKHGYTRIGRPLWETNKSDSPKMVLANKALFTEEIIEHADEFTPIGYSNNEYHFYEKGKLIGIEINYSNGATEYYIRRDV